MVKKACVNNSSSGVTPNYLTFFMNIILCDTKDNFFKCTIVTRIYLFSSFIITFNYIISYTSDIIINNWIELHPNKFVVNYAQSIPRRARFDLLAHGWRK